MGKLAKTFLVIVITTAVGFVGQPAWHFITNKTAPQITCKQLEQNKHCKGQIEVKLDIESICKLESMQASLDNAPLELDPTKITGRQNTIPITIDTTTLNDGNHILKVEAVDGGLQSATKNKTWSFYIDNRPLRAELTQSDFRLEQGRTLHIYVQTNKQDAFGTAMFEGKQYQFVKSGPLSTTYESFIPLSCEIQPRQIPVEISFSDSVGNSASATGSVKIIAANFTKQKNLFVPPSKLENERDVSISDTVLESALENWTKKSSFEKTWNGQFEVPTIVQRYTTPFGEIRTTAEKGRYIHKAVDIANTPYHVVWASQEGKIIIKERFLMTGNTVAVDHGMGIITLYCHLADFAEADVGDIVKKGNPVGKIGRTGYADGFHLHWELRVDNTAVDPLQWTKKNFWSIG